MNDRNHKNTKSRDRLLVESALAHATVKKPLSAEQVAERAGVKVGVARTHINNIVAASQAYNLITAKSQLGSYVWGRKPEAEKLAGLPEPRSKLNGGDYTGEQPMPRRAGALDAFTLPSLVAGERVARTRPAIICGKKNMEAVGVWG